MHKLSGETYRKVHLCVDSYESGVMKGRYYNQGAKGGGGTFESFVQFLREMEAVFDSLNFPQAFTAKRTFAPMPEPSAGEESGPGPQMGRRGTFVCRVLFRQHTSWQGSVTWIEKNSEQTFRSVLELILLIDSAFSSCEEETT